jgi:hypothetical protein
MIRGVMMANKIVMELLQELQNSIDVMVLAEQSMFRGCRCPNNGAGDCESCLAEQELKQQIRDAEMLIRKAKGE